MLNFEMLSEKRVLLLCVFHILQQVWRWLFDKSHGITKSDRVDIMKHFRKLVYARTVIDFDDITDQFMNSDVLNKYKNAVLYFNDLLELKTNWAHCFRTNLMTRGTNTNNYVEAQFLVIKDTILQRNRQFNVSAANIDPSPEELPTLTCTANEHMSEVFEVLSKKINQGNTGFNKAVLAFAKRFGKLSENQLQCALHSFGSIFVGKAKGRIKIQPTAVSRRKSKIGSRRKQDTKRVSSNKELPTRLIKIKRKHNISEVAKKAGRSMISVTTHPKKKIRKNAPKEENNTT